MTRGHYRMRAWYLSVFLLLTLLGEGSMDEGCPEVEDDMATVTYTPLDPAEIVENVTVNVTCVEGYVVQYTGGSVFSQVATCQASGVWSTSFAGCIEITCPLPIEYNLTTLTVHDSDLSNTSFGQTIEYRCVSGKSFETAIRPDQSETVVMVCDTYGQWTVIKGAVSSSNYSSEQFTCRALSEHMGCYRTDLPSTPQDMVIALDADKAIIWQCRLHCRQNSYLYAALQGERCLCTQISDFQSTMVAKEDCDVLCRNEALYCGGDDENSIYRALDSCVTISQLDLDQETSLYMYNSDTCIQHCRGDDKRLAFYREAMRLCTCFDTTPSYTNLKQMFCNTAYDSQLTSTLDGNLYVTAESANLAVATCEDLFDLGIFYHSYYYTQSQVKIHCHFLDDSVTCDQGWIAYNGHCYHLLETPGDVWFQAAACRNFSSLLTSAGDSAEWDFIIKMKKAITYSANLPFIGLYDIHDTYNYQWADETPFTYRNWAHANPHLVNDNKRCGCIADTQMANINCQPPRQAFCEKSDKNYCIQITDNLFDSQLTLYKEDPSMSVPLCFETCRGNTIDISLLNGTQCYCYTGAGSPVGFDRVDMSYCDLPCADNTLQICGSTSHAFYFVTQDMGQSLRESCDAMLLDGLATTALVQTTGGAEDCAAIFTVSSCPASWLPIGTGCYRPIKDPSHSVALACITMGGYLAVMETDAERLMYRNRVTATPSLDEISYWIGGLMKVVKNVTKYTYSNGAWVSQEDIQAAPASTSSRCVVYESNNYYISNETMGCNARPFICEKGSDYLGCYRRQTTSSGYAVIRNYSLMNVRLCKETCTAYVLAGYSLYGITIETLPTCYCLMPSEIEKESDSSCTSTCYGHQACGAQDMISVYQPMSGTPPSSCQELYDQGVLLSGVYEMTSPGFYSICYMPASSYTGSYPGPTCDGVLCDVGRVTIGNSWDVLSVDVISPTRHVDPGLTCYNVIEPGATTVASIRSEGKRDLLIDFLNWSVTGHTSTVIGLVDEFLTGSYTWSDGYLYRPGDVNLTEAGLPPLKDRSQAGYVTINHLGEISGHTDTHNVACMLDTQVHIYPDCFYFTGPVDLSGPHILSYNSMTVTLCLQQCQVSGDMTFFISDTDCICGVSSDAFVALTVGLEECTQPCPGNSLQLCGGLADDGYTYFRKYTFSETDIATDCRELYDNMVVREGVYKLATAPIQTGFTASCGLEDNTISNCRAGFMSKRNNCLRFIRLETETVMQAARSCLGLNSRLASLLTPGDLEAVLDITMNISSLSSATLWAIGHYSPLNNGYYVDAFGNMIAPSSEILQNVALDKQCMALDTERKVLVTVTCDTVLPYICHHKYAMYESLQAYLQAHGPAPDLSLPTSMTTHQCLEFCRERMDGVILVKDGDCFCAGDGFSLGTANWTDYTACPGHPFQRCGFSTKFAFHDGDLVQAQQYLTCDELVRYGITAPGAYVMADGKRISCFKYTSLSDYILANNESIKVEVSSVLSSAYTSSSARLDIRTLKPGGWVGVTSATAYSLTFDLLEAYMIQGIILMDVEGYDRMTSLSISHKLLDSHTENYFLNPVTINSPTSGSLTWVDIQLPFVASHVTITFNAWSGPSPGCSMEFIGYKFYQLWADTHYMGARDQVQNTSSITTTFISSDIENCVETCRTNGFNYFMINEESIPAPTTAECSCLAPSVSTRDFYTNPTGYNCLDTQPCGNNTSPLAFLYSTAAATCQLPLTMDTENDLKVLTQTSSGSTNTAPIGSEFSVTCPTGYTSSQWNGTFTTTCLNYGRWFPTPVDLTCTPVDCGPPPELTNLTLAATNGSLSTVYQSLVRYECEAHGHLINGTDLTWQVQCSASGQWLPQQPPSCIPKICTPPPPVLNSYLVPVPENYYVYGDVAVINCDAGSVFNGTYSSSFPMLCQMDGTWDSSPQVPCRALDCPPTLPPISHASSTLASDLSGLYECNGGREFPGQETTKTVLCDQDTNQWPATPATDVCTKTRQFGTNVCQVQKDKCMGQHLLGEVNSRGLVDCIITCSDTEFCRSVCYRRHSTFLEGPPNCLLVSSQWMYEHEVDNVGWDFYDTFGLACS